VTTNAEHLDITGLIGHREAVDGELTLTEVYRYFAGHAFEFVAVLEQERPLGICSRAGLGMLLGHQYGHALYARHKVRDHLVQDYLQVSTSDPLPRILSAAFARDSSVFYDDILLTDENGVFLGMIFMRSLVILQNRFFLKNITTLELQQEELRQKNLQMHSDLQLARQLQQTFLPRSYPLFPQTCTANSSLIRFHHLYRSADLLGGDFFCILPISDFSAGLFICDVVGHGVGAALITSMMRALVEGSRSLAASPQHMLAQINRRFFEMLNDHPHAIFATAAYLVADLRAQKIQLALAGHPHPVIINRAQATCRAIEPEPELVAPPLGILPETEFQVVEQPMQAGDMITVFTDGLFEVFGPDQQLFGRERLLLAMTEHAGLSPDALFAAVTSDITRYADNRPFADDVCIVGMEITGFPG